MGEGFSVGSGSRVVDKVIHEYPGREEAMKLAGHDFTVVEQKLYTSLVSAAPLSNGSFEPVEGYKALMRSDTSAVLHIAKLTYQPLQNGLLWDLGEALLGQGALWETAGNLRDGRVPWFQARLPETLRVPGDPSELAGFITAVTSHDASYSFMFAPSITRVICENTWAAAVGEAKRNLLSDYGVTIRHTESATEKVSEAIKGLQSARAAMEAYVELGTTLVEAKVSLEETEKFLKLFIEEPKEDTGDRAKQNVLDNRTKVRRILESDTTKAIAHTKWGLFQAGLEFLDHERKFRTDDTAFEKRTLREPRKQKLLRTVKGL